jgi:ribonuclease VapC
MIVDTSALLAVLLWEPEAARFVEAMNSAPALRLSVASYLEAAVFVERHGDQIRRAMLDAFLDEFSFQLEPVSVEQARVARQAYQWFGKGLHPAGLNYGDCFTYALAKVTREPLLFKGNDFNRTDLAAAVTAGG